jgi:hypothetical protein
VVRRFKFIVFAFVVIVDGDSPSVLRPVEPRTNLCRVRVSPVEFAAIGQLTIRKTTPELFIKPGDKILN